MGQVTGFLVKVSEKPTSNGGTIYNICVENDGNDDWFGYGFEAPTFGVDSEISFDIEVNGKFENVIVETLEIIDNQNAPAPVRKARGGASGGRGKPAGRAPRGGAAPAKPARQPRGQAASEPAARAPKADKKADVDWDRKDRLIRAQSCQNTAIATVALMQAAGVLPKPKAKSQGYDALQALIEKESQRLFLKYDEVADECYDYGGEEEGGAEEEGKGKFDDDGGIPE